MSEGLDLCRCPECGAQFGWPAAVASETAHQVLAAFGRLPPRVAVWIPLYLGMFRSASGALPWAQQRTTMAQLEPMIVKERVDLVTAQGFVTRPASAAVWSRGLEVVVGSRHKPGFQLPLTTNGYLLRTVLGLAEKSPPVPSASPVSASADSPREYPEQKIADAVFAGEISAEEGAARMRAIGISINTIKVMLGKYMEAAHVEA